MTRNNYRRNFRLGIAIIAALVLLSYGYFEARYLIAGPQVSIESPKTGSQTEDPLVTISGKAENISFISLNDRQIYVDKSGNFSEKLLLYPGYTIIKVRAKDRFGRTVEKSAEVVFVEKS